MTAQGIQFLILMASTMILARLLSPTDYGIVAMAAVVTGFIGMFKDAGLGMATIQQEKITREQISTLFWINVIISVALGLVVCAEPLVRVLLTDKWLPCVPYLQLLCIVGLLYPMHAINLNVLMAQGRSDLFFRLEIIKKVMAAIAILVTFRWGIVVMIYGQMATSVIAYYINSYYTDKLLKYPITEQVLDLLPTLGLAGLMGGAVFALALTGIESQVVMLGLQVATGVVVYSSLCWIFKMSSFVSILEKVGPRLRELRMAGRAV